MSRRAAATAAASSAASSAAPSPVSAQRSMRQPRAASSAAASLVAGDVLLSPVPSLAPSLLKRGRKRKDASLERPAADVSAALVEHYQQQRAARDKLGKQHDHSAGQHMPELLGQDNSLSALKDPELELGAHAAASNGSAHVTASPATRVRQVKQKVSRKKKRPGLTAAAAAAVGVTSVDTMTADAAAGAMSDQASAAADAAADPSSAAAAGAAAASSTTASIVPPVPSAASAPSLLTRAIPFIFHMLCARDLLRVEGVCSIWKHVASQPLVFNSATSWKCAPGDLGRVAAHPVLRHVKRLTLGNSDAAASAAAAAAAPASVFGAVDTETTRDVHLKGTLLSFSQIQVLSIAHLELDNLYALTEEFGELGQRGLRELHILRDSSLGASMRKRAAVALANSEADMQMQMQQQAEAEQQRIAAATAAAAAAAATASTDDVVAMEDVSSSSSHPLLQKAPSMMSMSDAMPMVAAASASASVSASASAPPSAMLVLSPALSTRSSVGGAARRLPSLYNIVSLLSLLPNLCVFVWQPLIASDFERPNVALKSLHTLKIRHPFWQRDEQCELSQTSKQSPSSDSAASFDPPAPPPPPPSEKTADQIHFLRKLPSLASLDWPGWSAENLRQFCAPLSSSGCSSAPSPLTPAQGGTLQDAINSALASGVYGPSGQPFIPSLNGGAVGSEAAHYSLGRSNQPQLSKLLLPFDTVADAHLASIANLKSLTHLSICVCAETLTDAGLQSLCSLELLQHLELKGVTQQSQTKPQQPMSITAPATPAASNTPIAAANSAAHHPASSDFLALPTASPGGHGSVPSTPAAAGTAVTTRPPTLASASASASASARPMSLELQLEARPAPPSLCSLPLVTAEGGGMLPPPIQLPEDAVAAADIAADAEGADDDQDAPAFPGRLLSRQESIVSYDDRSARSIVAAWSAASAVKAVEAQAQAAVAAAGSSCAHPLQLSRSASDPSSSNGSPAHAAASSSASACSPRRGSSGAPSFSELAVVRLSSLCSLRRLVLDQIDLGRDGLHTIFHSLAHLRVLELRRMSLPTLTPIACLPMLKSLCFKRCRLTNDEAMRRTLRQLKLLRVVEIKQCAGVSEHAVEEMQAECAAASSSSPHWPDLVSVQFESADSDE